MKNLSQPCWTLAQRHRNYRFKSFKICQKLQFPKNRSLKGSVYTVVFTTIGAATKKKVPNGRKKRTLNFSPAKGWKAAESPKTPNNLITHNKRIFNPLAGLSAERSLLVGTKLDAVFFQHCGYVPTFWLKTETVSQFSLWFSCTRPKNVNWNLRH